jgi:hypothetical protein
MADFAGFWSGDGMVLGPYSGRMAGWKVEVGSWMLEIE